MKVSGIPYVQGRNSYSDADGTKYAIAIHNTSNNASDENEASYATRRTDGVSSHFYCDRDSVIQSLDTAAKAGHAGSSNGNEHAVAVEITGANGWSRQTWLDNVAWDQLGRVLAQVCRFYNIPVRQCSVSEMRSTPKVKGFYSHDQMRQAWGGTTHTDPGPNFPWDRLLGAVSAAIGGTAAGGSYTVADSQLIANAERAVTAIVAGTEIIKFDYPWPGVPTEGFPNPIVRLEKKFDALALALASGGADPAAIAAHLADALGPLLPTLAEIEQIVDAKVKAAINATHLSV